MPLRPQGDFHEIALGRRSSEEKRKCHTRRSSKPGSRLWVSPSRKANGGTHTKSWGTPPYRESQSFGRKGFTEPMGVPQHGFQIWGTPLVWPAWATPFWCYPKGWIFEPRPRLPRRRDENSSQGLCGGVRRNEFWRAETAASRRMAASVPRVPIRIPDIPGSAECRSAESSCRADRPATAFPQVARPGWRSP